MFSVLLQPVLTKRQYQSASLGPRFSSQFFQNVFEHLVGRSKYQPFLSGVPILQQPFDDINHDWPRMSPIIFPHVERAYVDRAVLFWEDTGELDKFSLFKWDAK